MGDHRLDVRIVEFVRHAISNIILADPLAQPRAEIGVISFSGAEGCPYLRGDRDRSAEPSFPCMIVCSPDLNQHLVPGEESCLGQNLRPRGNAGWSGGSGK